MSTVTGFPFADPRTHGIQHKTGGKKTEEKKKSKSCSVDRMVLVKMSAVEIRCMNKGDRMVVVMLWRKIEEMIYARKWGRCRR